MPIISPKIPQGLEELMRGLAKSVIKENPENIYEFAAEYFENLLRERDGTVDQRYKKFATYKVYKKNKMARKQQQQQYQHQHETLIKPSTHFDDLEQGSSSKQNSDYESIEKIILPDSTPPPPQQQTIKQLSISSESEINTSVKQEAFVDDEGMPSKDDNGDDIENMVMDEEMEQAALKIQSTFRGHKTRKEIIETKTLPATIIKSNTGDNVECEKGSITEEEILACDANEIESEIVPSSEFKQLEQDENKLDMMYNDAEQENDPNQKLLLDNEKEGDIGNEEIITPEEEEEKEKEEGENNESFEKKLVIEGSDENALIATSQEEVVIEKEITQGSVVEEIETIQQSVEMENYEKEEENSLKVESIEKPQNDDDDIANMVLDEEMEEAALKIQSAFRGHKVRREIKPEEIEKAEQVNESDSSKLKINQELIENSGGVTEELVDNIKAENDLSESKFEEENQQPQEEIENDSILNNELKEHEHEQEEKLLEQIESIDSTKIDNASNNVIELNDEILMNEENKIVEQGEMGNDVDQDSIVNEENFNKIPPLTETNDENVITEAANISTEMEPDNENQRPEAQKTNYVNVEGRKNSITENVDEDSVIVASQMEEKEDEIVSIKNSNESETIEMKEENFKKEADPLAIESNEDYNEKIPTENNETDVPKNDKMEENEDEIKREKIKSSDKKVSLNNEKISEATGSIECNDENLNLIATESFMEMEEEKKKVEENMNDDVTTDIRQASCEKECEIEGEKLEALPTEHETVTNDDGKQISVEEEICEKKIISNLGPENLEEEEEVNKDLSDVNIVDDKLQGEDDTKASLEKMSSTDIKYEKLHESVEGKLSPSPEIEGNEDDEEKSIDGDSVVDSKNVSIDVENNESTEKETIKLEKILQNSISPIDLIDEVVNEVAAVKADEIYKAVDDAKNIVEELEEIIQPELIKLNERDEIPTNDLDVVNDEILKPDTEESEIPEENQKPMDENIIVSDEKSSNEKIENELEPEIIVTTDSDDKIPNMNDDEENVEDMILDEEMEEAAIKIQAAFRGHKSRKDTTSSIKSDSKQISEYNDEEGKGEEEENQNDDENNFNIVIDQCSPTNEETQEHEDNEQQDTSADIDEIQESEATAEQENNDENEEDETTNEVEEKTNDNEAETNEDENNGGGDDPSGEGETEGEEGTAEGGNEAQNNDDDDVANMVLDEEMEQAALKIQSTFRGHKTRKEIKPTQPDETKAEDASNNEQIDNVDDDIANMVLDEEMEQAALKIQSTFRGHKVRKDNKNTEEQQENEEENEEEKKEEEEEKEEPPKEEEQPLQSTSTEGKTAQQLQEEEDIANLVMDDEMEKTALKIQSAFRGKIKRKTPKDGIESYESSAEDGSNYEEKSSGESFQKSDENPPSDMYEYFGFSNENASDERGNSYDDIDYNNYSANRQSYSDDITEHFDVIEQRYDETIYPDDDINLMQGGGIFVEPSRDSQGGIMCVSSNEDDPSDGRDKNNSLDKKLSKSSEEALMQDDEEEKEEKLNKISEEKVIESFDFDQNKDTAEAMYYSLKKSEIEAQKRLKESIKEISEAFEEENELKALNEPSQENLEEEEEEDEDDDDVVMIKTPPSNPKILKYGMSMDDRLLGSILSQDYTQKSRKIYPDDGFDPLLEETMRCHPQFLERLHEMSKSAEQEEDYENINVGDDEDQFDDFYPGNIRTKIMASSISIADSDCFDPTNNKSIIDDDTIRTALETIHSTDSESTIASAATKIHANERNNLITHRNNNQYSSIGNSAIDKSLDDFIQSQEFRIDKFDEEAETSCISPPPSSSRKQESNDDTWTSDTCTESDKKHPMPGIIGIKLEQKQSHFLTIDERRRTLHREDAIQRNSTRSQEEDSSKSSSSEKIIDKINLQSDAAIVTGVQGQSSIIDTEIVVPVLQRQIPKSPLKTNKNVKLHILRQNTMPVQIESNVIRVLPKHLRKRIKSAESSEKKRKISK